MAEAEFKFTIFISKLSFLLTYATCHSKAVTKALFYYILDPVCQPDMGMNQGTLHSGV